MNFLKNKSIIQLIKNFFSLVFVKGVDFLIPLIIFPFLIKVLGFDKFGLLTFSLSVCLYFGAFIQYGFSVTAVREIARVKHNLNLLKQKFNNFFWTNVFLLFISLFLFTFLVFLIPIFDEEKNLYFITFFLVGMQSINPYWFFQGVEEMKLIAYVNLITKILYLISLLIFITVPKDYIYVYLFYAFCVFVGNVISILIIRYKFNILLLTPNFNEIKIILKLSRNSFITQFAPNFYNNTATFVLGLTVSNSLLGLYASAVKIIEALNAFGVVISSTFLPYLSRSLKNHKFYRKIMIFFSIVFCFLSLIFSKQIMALFVTDNIDEISGYFNYLVPMVFFIYFRLIFGPNYLMLINKERVYKNIILYTSLLFFFSSFYLIPKHEVFGAIFILVGASATMSVLTYAYYRKVKLNE